MTDLQHAKTFLDSLRAAAAKHSPNETPAMPALPTPEPTPEPTQKPPQAPLQTFSESGNSEDAVLPLRVISTLWMRFNGIYGARWESNFGPLLDDRDQLTPTAKMWAQTLGGLQSVDLSRGLHACIAASDDWPPTLPKFRALCEPPKTPTKPKYYRASDHQMTDAEKAASRAAGMAALAHIKTMLGMRT